jgi:hypothetical protein
MDEIEKAIREKAKEVVEATEIPKEPSAVEAFKQQVEFQLDTTKTYEEQAKDLIGVRATEKAIQDEDLTKGVTDRKKAEILNHADAHLKKEEAENKKAEILLQEANYGVYNGVATYAGIKKPLPQKMQNILFAILSAVQTILLLSFGLPISAINILADGVDSVVKKLATLTKSARWIVLLAILAGIVWLIVLLVKYFLVKAGIIL